MITAGVLAVIAWGALAFGAVYPWAYAPLLGACALLRLGGLVAGRKRALPQGTRATLVALLCLLAAGAFQLVPLPGPVLRTVSPSADEFLRNHDLRYAVAVSGIGTEAAAVTGDPQEPWHALSLQPRATAIGLGFLAAFTVFLAGTTRSLASTGARRLAGSVVVFGVALAVLAIVQKMMLGDHAWGGMKIYGIWTPEELLSTPFGPFVNKNHFAGWMLMALPLGAGVAIGFAEQAAHRVRGGWRSAVGWLSSPEGGRFQLLLVGLVVMGASLLMTRSRSGLAALLIAAVLLAVAARRRFGSARAGWAALTGFGALVLLAFVLAGADLVARIADGVEAVELRRSIWTDSATVIRDFPLTGTGLNTFGTAMVRYQTAQRDQHFQEAHNDYLQIAVEGGLLLVIPAVVALVLAIRAIRRRFAAREDDSLTYWTRVGATVGLIAVAAQSFVEFSLQMPGNAALFVVLLAIAMHRSPIRKSRGASRLGLPYTATGDFWDGF